MFARIPSLMLLWLAMALLSGQTSTDQIMLDSARVMPADSAYALLSPYLSQRYREGDWTRALAEGYHLLALNFQRETNNLSGLIYVDTALVIRQATQEDEHLRWARSYYLKGVLLEQIDANQMATDWLERAVNKLEAGITAGEEHPALDIMRGFYPQVSGQIAANNYDFGLAQRRLDQASSILETYPDVWTACDIAIDRGNMAQFQEDFSSAMVYYQEARRLAELLNRSDLIWIARFNTALAHSNTGSFSAAEVLFQELERERTAISPEQRTNVEHTQLGNLYLEILRHRLRTGKLSDIQPLLRTGLAELRYEFPNDLGGVRGELLTVAARAEVAAGNALRADSLFRAAFASLVDDYDPTSNNFLPDLANRTIYGQRELLLALVAARDLQRQQQTVPSLRQALTTSHTIDTLLRRNRQQFNLTGSFGQFLHQQRKHYASAVEIALELYRATGEPEALVEAYRFVATEKSNLLRRYLTGPGLARRFGVPDSLVRHQRRLELAALTVESAITSTRETATLRDSLLRLNTQLQLLKTNVKADYPAFARALQGYSPLDPTNIAEQLPTDQQLLEFFLTPDSLYVFSITRSVGLQVHVRPRPANLEKLVSSVVDGTDDGGYASLLADIPAPGIRRLQFIPDGQLWNLPFQALRLPDGRFLLEAYAVSYAYATPILFDQTRQRDARAELEKFRGFGIDYTDIIRRLTSSSNRNARSLRDLGPLPFASKEVSLAADKTGGQPLLNAAATKERFFTEAATADILHLAMHGLLAADPMESALVFHSATDSTYALLTMAEVLSRNFPVEMVVLSACHTGQGPIETAEGIQSIGRAFTAAGARSTIASTWAANDRTTYDILTDFYGYLKEGQARDQALQEAIVQYLREGTAADRQPVNWANLTLVGALDPIHKPYLAKWWPYLLGAVLLLGVGWLLGLFPAPAAAPNSERSDHTQRK